MMMPGRRFSAENSYRYGFNGKELDEAFTDDHYNFDARIYDARIGRWLSVDPLQKKYAPFSPYNFVENNPIVYIDKDGRDKWLIFTLSDQRTGTVQTISIKMSDELASDISGAWRDGQGHGSSGERNYYDININFNITVDKNGQVNKTLTESRGKFRISVSAGPSRWEDEKIARLKLKFKIWDISPTKQADIGSGFHYTSKGGKGNADPYAPGAEEISIIEDMDILIIMLTKGAGMADGPATVAKEFKDVPEEKIHHALEALVKALEAT